MQHLPFRPRPQAPRVGTATGTSPRLSEECERLVAVCSQGESITLASIYHELSAREHALTSLLLSAPFMLPIPIPGLSIAVGVLLMFVGIQMTRQSKPFLPKRWRERHISAQLPRRIFTAAARLFRMTEHLIRPRGRSFTRYGWVRRSNGVVIALCGLLLALPLPPGTNFPPALTIVLLSIANLEEDSLVLALGYFALCINLALFTALAFLGYEGLHAAIEHFAAAGAQ